ncbi:S26 family signal peptidase [Nocardioides sp.]|uniref:S26 family signal peptidase n=1 Tax=Nocardioides sp. TaxID=35761 RepID=UPI003519A4FD
MNGPTASTPRRAQRLRRLVLEAAVITLVALAMWWVHGGRWLHVDSPSMGTAAPVGSLLWVVPSDYDRLEPGDVITFRAPGSREGVYTHRVVERTAAGLRTRGDLTSPDPWVVAPEDIVGEVRMTWRGVGWLVVCAPVLIPGGLLTLALTRLLPLRRRRAAALVLAAGVAATAVVVHRPLVGVERIGQRDVPGGSEVSFVGTGLLPVRVGAPDPTDPGAFAPGRSTVVHAGEVGTVRLVGDSGGRVPLQVRQAVAWWVWMLVAASCLLPGLIALARQRGRRALAARGRRRAHRAARRLPAATSIPSASPAPASVVHAPERALEAAR